MADSLIPRNHQAPHRAVVWLYAEVHELLQTGECTGMPVYKVERFPVYLDGLDQNIAIRKLNELLAEVKEKCRNGGS